MVGYDSTGQCPDGVPTTIYIVVGDVTPACDSSHAYLIARAIEGAAEKAVERIELGFHLFNRECRRLADTLARHNEQRARSGRPSAMEFLTVRQRSGLKG